MDKENIHDKELVLAQVLYLYVIPTLLLYYKIIPGQFRLVMLFSVALFLYGIIKRAHWTYEDLEIRKNFIKDLFPYAIFTILGVALLYYMSEAVPAIEAREHYRWWENARFLALFIPISVLQEIIVRGILMHMLKRALKSIPFIIILNASLFALIHIIYLNTSIIMPLTFIGGLGFAWMYHKYPNLIMISISHTVLNFTAMILGFFVLK